MEKILSPFRQSKLLNTLFLSNIFISFHYALIIYINSSFLSNLFSEREVSFLYIFGSIIDTFVLLNASKILQKIGSYKFILYAICSESIATFGMATSNNPSSIGLFFLIHLVTISVILFNMDVLIESISTDESETGSIRATYLTLTNITIVMSPSLIAFLFIAHKYSYVYIVSFLFLIPLFYLIQRFRNMEKINVSHIKLKETISEYRQNKNLYNIFTSQFFLQLFYAYMVIYMPLYLEKYIGFSWSEIGIIFTIMLLPFVLFELPVGELADKKYGEKEFLTVGFIIMGLSTLFVSFITVKNFWIWIIILFISRIGASFVEITTESFFFKHVNQEKTNVISFFRISRPLSFIIAPLTASLFLEFIPYQYIFILVGSLMIFGAHYSLALRDTK